MINNHQLKRFENQSAERCMSSRHAVFMVHRTSLRQARRRGTILVMVLWGMIVLAGIILVFGRTVQVEAISSRNRVAAIQTAAVVRGAEQYVLSLVENASGDPTYVVDATAESMAVGQDPMTGLPLGYFWIIKPDTGNPELTAFGLVDESSKININNAERETLMRLPKMTEDIADAIIDWRDTDENITGQGGESSYYASLPQGYSAKNDRFETIEELRLVVQPRLKDPLLVQDFLYGYDLNHDGILSPRESNSGGMASVFSSATNDGRGIAPFITVYSVESNSNSGRTDVNGDSDNLRNALRKVLQRERADRIVQVATSAPRPPGNNTPRFSSVFDFCAKGMMTPEEVRQVYDTLHANRGRTSIGKINLNTAPREVVAALPGLEEQDAENLVSKRLSEVSTSQAWIYEALGPEKAAAIGSLLTNKSYQYSADIVAISTNGKSFKRIRIVADARRTPARIVYRKDVTDLGWPLEEGIRYTLQQGGTLETPFGSGGSGL